MRHGARRVSALACGLALAACSATAPPERQIGQSPAPALQQADAGAPATVGPPLEEAHARALLEELFRARGLRILRDVEVEVGGVSLAADGFDPHKLIGFEYTDERERALQGALGEQIARSGTPRLLFLLPSDEATVRERAQRFLDDALPLDAGPD